MAERGQAAVLDPLDRKIVAALQSDGRASWTDIANVAATSVTTVARRGQRLLDDGVVKVAVVPAVDNAGPANLYLLRLQCSPGVQTKVARELSLRQDTRLVSVVTGHWDVLAELAVRKAESLSNRLVGEILAIDGVQRCDTDIMLHTYKVSHDWSRQLVTGEPYVYSGDEPHECHPSHLDDVDRAIIERMREDGRASFRAIASAVGVNESTARRRFEAMHGRGCVWLLTLVPAAALGFESEIIVDVGVDPGRVDAVAKKLSSYRGVRFLSSMLGRNSVFCEIILPSRNDVFEFMTRTLGRLDGVRDWSASIELVTFKRGFVETPWWKSAIE